MLLAPESTHVHCRTSPGGRALVRNSRSRDSWACHSCVSSLAPSPSRPSKHKRDAGDRDNAHARMHKHTQKKTICYKTEAEVKTENSWHAWCPSHPCTDMRGWEWGAETLSCAGMKTNTSEWKQNPAQGQWERGRMSESWCLESTWSQWRLGCKRATDQNLGLLMICH